MHHIEVVINNFSSFFLCSRFCYLFFCFDVQFEFVGAALPQSIPMDWTKGYYKLQPNKYRIDLFFYPAILVFIFFFCFSLVQLCCFSQPFNFPIPFSFDTFTLFPFEFCRVNITNFFFQSNLEKEYIL